MSDAQALFNSHRTGVLRYLRRIVGDRDAGELTQDVFCRVARGPLPHGDAAIHRAWIFTIARNLALNHLRNDRRRGEVSITTDAPSAPTQELATALAQALATLEPKEREVFLMREQDGLSYAEIATASNLTVDAVRSRLHRARLQLRGTLAPATRPRQVGVTLYDQADSD